MSVGRPQQILSGKYRLERELGRGGMGAVWLAEHLTLGSPVAIKLIDPGVMAENPEALPRFMREARAAAALRSPHVVQILDHGVDESIPFIVMELLEGESLAARLERQGRLSPAETARIMTQVARAVTRAHEAGIIHRDLKPDNIFLVHNDEEEVAKVLDFGIAKASSHGLGAVTGTTRTGSVLGTPYYMSPEQAEGSKHIDHRSDLWSLGVIAWECLLGTRPFDEETLGGLLLAICAREIPAPSSLGPVPPGFDAWFSRACSRRVAHRFGSAKELAAELRQVCAQGGADGTGNFSAMAVSSQRTVAASASTLSLASTTNQLGLSSTPEPPKKKASAPVLIAAGLALAGAAAAAVLMLRSNSDEAAPSTPGSAAARLAPAPVSPTVPAAAPPAPALEPAVKVTPPAPAAGEASGAAAPPVRPRPSAVRPVRPSVAASASPSPVVTPQPAAKQRVNLGI